MPQRIACCSDTGPSEISNTTNPLLCQGKQEHYRGSDGPLGQKATGKAAGTTVPAILKTQAVYLYVKCCTVCGALHNISLHLEKFSGIRSHHIYLLFLMQIFILLPTLLAYCFLTRRETCLLCFHSRLIFQFTCTIFRYLNYHAHGRCRTAPSRKNNCEFLPFIL